MTHESDPTTLEPILQLLIQHGFDGAAEALEILLNAAMKLERTLALKAEPYERTPERQGHANGFKPKTVRTRVGELDLQIPQVRDGIPFYPSALEKGLRSERAPSLALAEMYVSGVSTRKMRSVLETMCGSDITSTQVSRPVQQLDAELEQWRRLAQFLPFRPRTGRFLDAAGQLHREPILIATGARGGSIELRDPARWASLERQIG